MEIKKDRIYEIKPLSEPIGLTICEKKYKNIRTRKFTKMYDLIKNQISVTKIPVPILEYVKNCERGFYGTPEGHFLCDNSSGKIDRYYYNEDRTEFFIDKSLYNLWKKEAVWKEGKDVVYYEPIKIFDINSKYYIEFRTDSKSGYLNYYDIKFKKGDFKIENKDISIETEIEKYKNEIVEKGKTKGLEYLFGQEAKDFYFNKRKMSESKRKKRFFNFF